MDTYKVFQTLCHPPPFFFAQSKEHNWYINKRVKSSIVFTHVLNWALTLSTDKTVPSLSHVEDRRRFWVHSYGLNNFMEAEHWNPVAQIHPLSVVCAWQNTISIVGDKFRPLRVTPLPLFRHSRFQSLVTSVYLGNSKVGQENENKKIKKFLFLTKQKWIDWKWVQNPRRKIYGTTKCAIFCKTFY